MLTMTNQEILQEYSKSINKLKKESISAGIKEDEFKKMYFKSLEDLKINTNNVSKNRHRFFKNILLVLLCLSILILITYNFKTIYGCMVCKMQDYIYPGLRMLRKFTIPFISLFPALTELYQETCLIQNPYFTVVDMDCWPCSTVNNVGEVFNPQPVHKQQTAPFIYKTDQNEINLNKLKKLYLRHKNLFDKESPKMLINNQYYWTPQDVFGSDLLKENLYLWKFNNYNAARILRQVIPRPKVVPKFGQSTERFIIIDSNHDKFHIPDTECNYSFLLALSGSRIIDLKPAEECKHQCKSFRMELKQSYLLWYNWWYWRPVVQPSIGNETFIAHVGSYC
ncbi:uncharacterized protein LOC123866244 isoform X1 [Maniola jurtina]|uniref:uncharacterized protein LOC123866244 isoform X1 n=2 Tax=Maniola jurtina TaxID=191418 RepID=UPI001E686330|nr:uncharacterized protein LOC123866244 isoform X1 [Maniola jurtina]